MNTAGTAVLIAALIVSPPVLAQGAGPGPRTGHGATYHPDLEMVLVFGGRTGAGVAANDLWGWDGSRWHELDQGSEHPPPRARHVLVFDRLQERVVLQGGGTSERDLEDSWAWTPDGWTRLGEEGPGPRSHHQGAYDPDAQSVLLYGGGRNADGFGNDLWSLGDGGWRLLEQTLSPGRVLAGMASTDHAVLLFGGLARGGPRSRELWQWMDGEWTLLHEGGPQGRIAPGLAWDPSREELILFGGETSDGLPPGTWIWNGLAWRRIEARPEPPPRTEHTLVYDEARHVVVMFGGRTAEGSSDELWEWDGDGWTRRR